MISDGRLSGVLHLLLHMISLKGPVTSTRLAGIMATNPVVIRRLLAGLRRKRFVRSLKGPGGGWTLVRQPGKITLREVYEAIGAPPLFAIGNRNDASHCAVEQVVNNALSAALIRAEALLLGSFDSITLADLAGKFPNRAAARQNQHRICQGRNNAA
ncbi:MAG TPA: Rrf2 family transcriptional regulator [Micropepsaceae bacterium]|nr:Rrf2 family transcriptional regulator [Micropepsaceae bacterium]